MYITERILAVVAVAYVGAAMLYIITNWYLVANRSKKEQAIFRVKCFAWPYYAYMHYRKSKT